MFLPRKLKSWLVDTILAKPVPTSGVIRMGSGVEAVDCKVAKILHDGDPWLIVEGRTGGEISCAVWDGSQFSGNQSFPLEAFSDRQFQVKHYFGPQTIYYESLSAYAVGHVLRMPYLAIRLRRLFERIGTVYYNRRRIVVAQRIDVLTFMIERSAAGSDRFSSLDLMTNMHSLRWITHPQGESARTRLEFILDSLCETGELRKVNGEYFLTGLALRLVEESAEQEAKHKQGIAIQRMIALLTLVTVGLAVVQAGLIKLSPIIDLTK